MGLYTLFIGVLKYFLGWQARSQTFFFGGGGGVSNRSNCGTFYDYSWIFLRSHWIWPFFFFFFWGGGGGGVGGAGSLI